VHVLQRLGGASELERGFGRIEQYLAISEANPPDVAPLAPLARAGARIEILANGEAGSGDVGLRGERPVRSHEHAAILVARPQLGRGDLVVDARGLVPAQHTRLDTHRCTAEGRARIDDRAPESAILPLE